MTSINPGEDADGPREDGAGGEVGTAPELSEVQRLLAKLATGPTPAERVTLELRLAELRCRVGEFDQALLHLAGARGVVSDLKDARRAAEIDALAGIACVGKGELERARAHLDRAIRAGEAQGEADLVARAKSTLGEVALASGRFDEARGRFEAARVHYDRFWNGAGLARALLGLAAVAANNEDLLSEDALTSRAFDEAKAAADPLMLGRALLARAAFDWRRRDARQAKRGYRRAIAVLQESGLRRELAEAYYRYGVFTAEAATELPDGFTDPPAYWLAKAQALLQELGVLADLERVREAFRRHGRRATDRVSEVEVRKLMQVMKGQRMELARAMTSAVDDAGAWLGQRRGLAQGNERGAVDDAVQALGRTEQAMSRRLSDMAAAEESFLAALNTLIIERENIRLLLDLTRQLSSLADWAELVSAIGKMAAQLVGADRALLVLTEAAAPGDHSAAPRACHEPAARVLASVRFGDLEMAEPEVTEPWRKVVHEVLRKGAPVLAAGEGAREAREKAGLQLGVALGAPLRKGHLTFGCLYVDKDLCGGVFTERDLDLLTIFSVQVTTILDNTRIAEELRLAARTKAATLEAIHDGVLSVDAHEVVTSLNQVAARALGVQATTSGRLKLAALPELGVVRAALTKGEDVDARVTKLASGDVLLNVRIVRDDAGAPVGCVATFTEMKRAQSLAQRIVGSEARFSLGDIVGRSGELRRRLQLAEAAARSDSSVLITGESGTGKELFAQAIHNAGPRAAGPFVGINCSAIPRELLESELFGYEAGAFTGAKKGGHPGKFELAEGGTILLDEIGDMPLEMQVKLLRVLQEKRLTRVGGMREVRLDARVIATTHRELTSEVERGSFRQDLFYRLKVIAIELPSLRERIGDIPMLVEHFLGLFAARLGKRVRGVTPQVMAALEGYAWPGNIRELEHVLESEINLATDDQLLLDEIPDAIRPRARKGPIGAVGAGGADAVEPGRRVVGPADVVSFEAAERELLLAALTQHQGRVPEVARALGVSRGTVYNKLRKFQIDPTDYRGS